MPVPSPSLPPVAAVLVAAGKGTRMGGTPKQFRDLAGATVLARAWDALVAGDDVERVALVYPPGDADALRQALDHRWHDGRLRAVEGGASRQASVRLGIEALAADGFPEDGVVLVHDAARPFLPDAVRLRAILAGFRHGAAIPVLPVADTLATLDDTGRLIGNPDRAAMRLVQTPQAFRFGRLREAHRRAEAEARSDFTDDAGLVAAYGQPVASFAGDPDLFKLTHEADFARAERHLAGRRTVRTGFGYDIHAFGDGEAVWLGGVRLPHGRALSGHSDADPALHALTDALYGTIGDGDIGSHFPPGDPQWRGAASIRFLEAARDAVHAQGGTVVSVDLTIVAEAPKIGPHRAAMQAAIGTALALPPGRIGIKATTNEGLGAIGRREGIAAFAVASVAFPE